MIALGIGLLAAALALALDKVAAFIEEDGPARALARIRRRRQLRRDLAEAREKLDRARMARTGAGFDLACRVTGEMARSGNGHVEARRRVITSRPWMGTIASGVTVREAEARLDALAKKIEAEMRLDLRWPRS